MDVEGLPWDSPKFTQRDDTEWTAGCRWLQSWWREQEGLPAGELSQAVERPVSSMLPLGTKPERNFYGANVVRAMDERILNGSDFPMAALDRMFRDLLSSQTACTNLLGEFAQKPNDLLPWVQTIDPEASAIGELQLAWAPKKKLAVGGGSPFTAFVEYRAGERRRFLAVECIYADNLADSKISVRPTYVDYTEANGSWRAGASRRLDRPGLRQLWLNAMLAQSLRDKDDYDAGRVVVMACAVNPEVRTATDLVRSELLEPDSTLVWSPMEAVVDTLGGKRPEWAKWIRKRYLDFTPVEALLDPKDPRLAAPPKAKKGQTDAAGLKELVKVGPRVTGNDGVVGKLLKRIEAGKVDPRVVAALDDRARELANDLKAFREALDALK